MQIGLNKYLHEIKDTLWLILLQGLNYLIPLFIWPYLMVTLGADGFGRISFGLTVAQLLMLLVDFGFNWTATKIISQNKDNQQIIDYTFSTTMAAKLCLLACSAIILGGLMCMPKFAIYRWVLLIFFIMVLGNTFTYVWLYQGFGHIREVSIVTGVIKIMVLPLTFIFVHDMGDLWKAALILSIVHLISGVVMTIWTNRRHWVHWVTVGRKDILATCKNSFPIFLSNAVGSVYTLLFVFLLTYFASPVEVGKYAAVEKIIRAGCFCLLTPIIQSFYPKISQMAIGSKQEACRLITKIIVVIIPILGVFGGMLFFASDWLMQLLGKDYEGTQVIFRILAFVPIFIAMGGVTGQLGLLAIGNEQDKKYFSRVYVFSAFFALAGILALSQGLNAILTAWLLFAVELITMLVMCTLYYKRIVIAE